MTLIEQMYLALKSVGCRCEYARIAGVPVWAKAGEAGIARTRLSQCSLCAARERYEREVLKMIEPTVN
jgi:hypothetical protein